MYYNPHANEKTIGRLRELEKFAKEELGCSLMHAAMALANNQMIYSHHHDKDKRTETMRELAALREAGEGYEAQLTAMQRAQARPIMRIYYRTFECADKAIAVACGSVKLRKLFIAAVGLEDESLAITGGGGPDWGDYYEELALQVEKVIRAHPAAHWLKKFSDRGIPVSEVKMPIEMFDDEQALVNGMLYVQDHPAVGPVTLLGTPVALDDAGFSPGPPTALFGTEARTILREIGFADERIDAFVRANAVHEGRAE